MSAFSDMLAADAAAIFCDAAGGFAEPVTYVSRSGSRPLNAEVFRNPPAPVAGAKGAAAPSLSVFIANDPVAGVTAVEAKVDQVTVAERVGEAARSFHVIEILSQDAGGWLLKLR